MGDLTKLRVAAAQVDVVEGRGLAIERALDRAIGSALEGGADVLVALCSLKDARDIRLYALNDTRLDIAGNVAVLDACDETYRVALGSDRADCDFSVLSDVSPYTLKSTSPVALPEMDRAHPCIVLRPVGMLDAGKCVCAFDGGSAAFGFGGARIAALRDDFVEDVRTFTFADGACEVAAADRKLLSAVVTTLRRFDAQVLNGAAKWVIGLSGGLDSCVVAALLTLAFGPDRIVAYSMSTRFNSETTKANAMHVARSLGITLRCGSIENMVVSLGNTLVHYGYAPDALSGLALENAQARSRGQLLSAFSALEGGVVVNNGNRVEGALGYATLYGDSIGALAPIGDLTKVNLFGLAHDVNETFGYEVVPANLLPEETQDGYRWETMPSAELARAQRDPMKWFYHDWLIGRLLGDASEHPITLDDAACDIMENYLENCLEDTPAAKWVRFYGLEDPRVFLADLEWVLSSMRKASFKRIQAPPYIALASRHSIRAETQAQVAPEASSRYAQLAVRLGGYASIPQSG